MWKRIVIIDGHPDASADRFVHALADAYQRAANVAGHEVRTIAVAALQFDWLHSNEDFLKGQPPQAIQQAQKDISWADHVVILFPLWLGAMPALLKAFFEQTLRPGFAFAAAGNRGLPKKLLAGKSARIIVTMGMPALFYRWYFRAHSLKSLERNILGFCGMKPIRTSLIGSIENPDNTTRHRWIKRIQTFARSGK